MSKTCRGLKCARHISQNVSSLVPLYPFVYSPMALALFFDRVFENPFFRRDFLRDVRWARTSLRTRSRARPHTHTQRTSVHSHDMIPAEARVCGRIFWNTRSSNPLLETRLIPHIEICLWRALLPCYWLGVISCKLGCLAAGALHTHGHTRARALGPVHTRPRHTEPRLFPRPNLPFGVSYYPCRTHDR